MRTTARRLADLIVSLLDHAAIESGKLDVCIEPVDPRALAEDMPPLETDPRLLRLVLVNLVGNAIRFTDRGTVIVSVGCGGDAHSFEVRDTGPGIPPEDRRRIFDPFEQLEPIRHKHNPGVGLGLAIVDQLVTSLGGEIALASEVGRGSAFKVVLPSRGSRVDPADRTISAETTRL